MCGICGIIKLDGTNVDQASLDLLTDSLSHRGPDGRGVYIDGSVGLGHRRLKVLDLSEASRQPMVSEDGSVVLVFNGEIYNFQELRSELATSGYHCKTTGDTEVLLQMYRHGGIDMVRRLRGQFAFAIYDKAKRSIVLVRDRVGKKPLKYFLSGSTFAFASELKALRCIPGCPSGIDEASIHHYLTMMYIPSPETGIAGIKKLSPASMISIDLSLSRVSPEKRYWNLSYEPKQDATLAEWQQRIGESFDESVRLRMIADVPVGAFLSGGIDSGAVVATMARHSSRPIETFSIGSDEESHNELPLAAMTARYFGTNHHPIRVTPDIVTLLPELVRTYEEPFADPSSIPMYLITRETAKHVTVALNGDGGDENFCGYVRYPILQFSSRWARVPLHRLIRPLIRSYHNFRRSTLTYRMQRFVDSMHLPWEERYLSYLSFFDEEEKRQLYRSNFPAPAQSTASWYASKTVGARTAASSMLEQAMSMDLQTYLADDLLPKVDLGSMAHGLEARSPLLDHTLLELTASMPIEYKLRGRIGKWIFRRMLTGVLPPEVLSRPKTGFRLPLDRWFRTTLEGFVRDRLLSSTSPLLSIIDRASLESFLGSYFASSIDYSDHVWALLWLDEWMRQYS